MNRPDPHRVVRTRELEDPEIRDHEPDLVEPGRRPDRLGPVVSDPADEVDVLDEAPLRVARNPVARRVVDRVPRRSPDPDQLSLRTRPVADRAQVLIPV